MSVWRFADGIAPVAPEFRLTLGEGNTPLLPSRSIGPQLGLNNLWFKLETTHPSGSYKDRFAAVAISDMLANGKRSCLATSSGNTGSALAAYCALAGIQCRVAIVEKAPLGKLLQMQAYGAELVRIRNFGTDADVTERVFERLTFLSQQSGTALQISGFRYSPTGMSGVRTIGYEILEQLPSPPQHVFCPGGGGGLTLAVAQAFEFLNERHKQALGVRVHCVQPVGNSTIAGPLREGAERANDVACTTAISGLQVPSIIDGHEVIRAVRRCGGTGFEVEDEQVWQLQLRLAREEGIFCEPAGAVALAGALTAASQNEIDANSTIVCLVTGSGFKDSPSLQRMAGTECPIRELDDLGW
ncbi:MAG: pyridoxal-phosphate dependent enzyme [Planctomycetota bacterium]|nr:pyridoxal-phosphate dependent enzyme [Planctomycetota bacterium]